MNCRSFMRSGWSAPLALAMTFSLAGDLPLNCHPTAIRASAVCVTP